MRAGWGLKTNVRAIVVRGGHVIHVAEMHNVITENGMALLRDAIMGAGSPEITWVGVGNDNTAPADSDTALGDERLRVPVVKQEAVDHDQVITTAHIGPYEANDFTINELGFFGGSATSALDSGTLLARVLYNHTKSVLDVIHISRTDTISEVV